jgi:hypothetical protein
VFTELGTFLGFLTRSCLGVGILFGIGGIVWLWKNRRDVLIGLGLIFVCNVFFFVNYRVLDKDTMFLPAYLVSAILVAAGAQLLSELIEKYISSKVNHGSLDFGLKAVLGVILVLGIGSNWQWVDLSKTTWPSQFGNEVMTTAEPNSTIIADWSSAVILEYFQLVEGERTDLRIINRSRIRVARYYRMWEDDWQWEDIIGVLNQEDIDLVQHALVQGSVYVIEYDPLLSREFVYLPEGSFFQLASKP